MGERGTCPKSLVERVDGCRELGCRSAVWLCCVLVGLRFDGFMMVRSGLASIDPIPVPLHGTPCFPFYRPRESMSYNGRKEKKLEGEDSF